MTSANGLIKLGFTPEIDFSLQDDGDGAYIRSWMSASPQPSEAEIETAHAEWQAEYDSQEYARNRRAEYPSIEECVHAILDDDVDALLAKRAEIKAKYPKP
jgi:fatty acid/phospholipid biosynthesis enzyme